MNTISSSLQYPQAVRALAGLPRQALGSLVRLIREQRAASARTELTKYLLRNAHTPENTFDRGAKVTQVGDGLATEGYVIEQTPDGVLVDFVKGGRAVIDPVYLCRID